MATRPYASDADVQAILDLIAAIRPPQRIADFPGAADLREMLALPVLQADTCLWHDAAGVLAGYAILDETNLIFEAAQPALLPDMMAWGADRVRQQGGKAVETGCREDDLARLALLEAAGYARQPDHAVHFVRPLDEPVPAPPLPAGFTIRPLAGEAEVEAWVTLHRAAWGTEHMTVEYKRAMMAVPDYDPVLDLVAVAPNGDLAAYCVCFISEEENALSGHSTGHTDPIATHPAYQRLGLARALVLEGLKQLKARGMTMARTGTGSDNIAMQHTAHACGFRLESRTFWYCKPLA